jgi:hypothetical protein
VIVAPAEFVTYTFTPLSTLTLVPGATYLAVINQQSYTQVAGAELDLSYNGSGALQPVSSSLYLDGSHAGPSYANSTWSLDGGQAAFTATLVPEPSSLVLLSIALAVAGVFFFKRSRSANHA